MASENRKPIDATYLACSLPLVKLAARMRKGRSGETFEAFSNMPGFLDDVNLWCQRTGHTLVSHLEEPTGITVIVRKR